MATFASYGGFAIFGSAVKMQTSRNPVAVQKNNFFGASGQESLFGGTRGQITSVQGLLVGESVYELGAALLLFDSYYDGIARTLVNTFGISFSNVLLQSFEPSKDGVKNSGYAYYQSYTATFEHLN